MPVSKRPVQARTRPSRIGIPPTVAVVFSMGCMALLLQGCFSPSYPTLDGEEVRKKELKERSEQAVHDAMTELDQLIRTASQAKLELARIMGRADARLSELAGLREAPAEEFLAPDESFTAARNGDDSEEPYVVNGWTYFTPPQKTAKLSSDGSGEREEEVNLAGVDGADEPYVVNGWTYFTHPQNTGELSPDDSGERDELSSSDLLEPEQADRLAATPPSAPEGVPEPAVVDAPVAKVEVRILHVEPEVQTMEPPRSDGGAVPKAEISGLLPYPRESFLVRMAEEVAARREEKERRQALEPLQPLVPEEKVE